MAKQKTQENKDKFQETLDRLEKQYGVGSVTTLDYKVKGEYDVISTGSIGFDYGVLGVGGFVKGKLYELRGWESSGKSTICGHAVAECQKKGGTALYIDGEHALDKNYFQALGVDTTKLLISQPSIGEDGYNIVYEMIKTGKIDLVIIDSDSSLIPKKVVDGEIGDFAIGKKAMLNSSAYPKIKNALVQYNTCVIVVSQYREKIGVMFGPSTTTQGGNALKYYSDGIIEVSKSLAKEGDDVYGNITKVKSTKNKTAPPYRSTSFEIIYGHGIDKIGEMIELINDLELGKKWGQTISIGEDKYDINEFKVLLEDNPEFYEEIKQKIINKMMNIETEVEEKGEESNGDMC